MKIAKTIRFVFSLLSYLCLGILFDLDQINCGNSLYCFVTDKKKKNLGEEFDESKTVWCDWAMRWSANFLSVIFNRQHAIFIKLCQFLFLSISVQHNSAHQQQYSIKGSNVRRWENSKIFHVAKRYRRWFVIRNSLIFFIQIYRVAKVLMMGKNDDFPVRFSRVSNESYNWGKWFLSVLTL